MGVGTTVTNAGEESALLPLRLESLVRVMLTLPEALKAGILATVRQAGD